MGAEDFVKLSVRYRIDFGMTGTSPLAELLFIRGLAYCGLNDTRGLIPASELVAVAGNIRRPEQYADELVRDRYWQASKVGWCIRSWDKWQHDFDQVAEKRRRDAERKRLERQANRRESIENGGAA
jgi:hypothetical protein